MASNVLTSTLLAWHRLVGADEIMGHAPCSLLAPTTSALGANTAPVITSADEAMAEFHRVEAINAAKNRLPTLRPVVGLGAPIPSFADALLEAKTLAAASQTFEQWQENVRAFEGCPLKRTATNTVVGDGNPNSKLLFIGEAPGNDEDKQGIPFCGASGQLLDKMLAAIGLTDRSHYYISNSIYWRPPGNRNPTPDEVALCKPFLEKLIALIQPRMIILVGGVATKNVLEIDTGITKLRGKIHSYVQHNQTYNAFALYHPSYLLRQPIKKRDAWADLLVLRDLIKQ